MFRLGTRVIRACQTLVGGRLYTPIALVFASRFTSFRTDTASALVILALVAVFLVSFLAASGLLGYDSYNYLPNVGGAGELNALSYVDGGTGSAAGHSVLCSASLGSC